MRREGHANASQCGGLSAFALMPLLALTACVQELASPMADMAAGCVAQNSETNACELDGVTVRGTPTDDDGDDEENDENDGRPDDEDEEEATGGGGNNDDDECGDDRDALIAEYVAVDERRLGCSHFTRGWESELNQHEDNDHDWLLVYEHLAPAVAHARSRYPSVIEVTSGYRCPEANIRARSKSRRSWHIYGQAADVFGNWPRNAPDEYRSAYEELARIFMSYPSVAVTTSVWEDYKDKHLHIVVQGGLGG